MVKRKDLRSIRKKRIRVKINGSGECPRLSVFRSARHISVQAIDDSAGVTIASAATVDKNIKLEGYKGNKAAAERVGELIGEKLIGKNIEKVVFDRNGFHYQGRVSALAEAVRKKGLIF